MEESIHGYDSIKAQGLDRIASMEERAAKQGMP